MDDSVAEIVELRQCIESALNDCRNYESQLRIVLKYFEKQRSVVYPESFKSLRLQLESVQLRSQSMSKLFSDSHVFNNAIAHLRSIENQNHITDLQRHVDMHVQQLPESKQKQKRKRRQRQKQKLQQNNRQLQLQSNFSGDLDELKPKVSDLLHEKHSRLSSGTSDASAKPSPRTDHNDSHPNDPNDHFLSGQDLMDDVSVFDYITTTMLRGTQTKSSSIQSLCLDRYQNKTEIFHQMFRVLHLYQKLISVAQDLQCQTETRAALMKIKHVTSDILDAELVNIYTFDKKKNIIECLDSDIPSRKGFSLKAGDGIVGRIVQKPETLRFKYEECDSSSLGLLPCEYGSLKVKSVMIHPILDDSSKTLLGIVQCFNKKSGDGCFSVTDEEILKQIVRHAAIVLATIIKFHEEKKRQERNEAILDIVKTVHTDEDIDHIISKVVEASYRVVRCDRVSVFMIDPSTNELWFKVSKDAEATGFRFPVGKGIAGFVAASGESLNIIDAYQDERFSAALDRQSNYRTRTVLCVPVCNFRGKPVAVIQCINKHCALCDRVPCVEHQIQFEDSDVEIMQTFAREIASALQRKAQESSFQQAMDMNGNKSHMKDYISQFIGGQARRLTDARSDMIEWPLSSTQAAQSSLCDWNFDLFEHSVDELLGLSENIYDILELTESFKIPRITLRNFLFEIRGMYYDNPYHNFRHAFSVMHMCFLLITTTSAKTILTGADILALITASLGHDLGHPGLNNDFLIHSEDALSVLYNDVSVLENHHAASLCQLLRKQETDILSGLSKPDRQILRKSMVDAILHTDMSQHKLMLEALIKRSNASMKLDRNSSVDRQLMVNNILHCSDIGNPVLPINMGVKWAELIQQEFYLQAKREKEMNLPYAAFMLNTSRESLANLQVNFITYVVRPIWKAMNDFLPELSFAMERMDENKANWETIIKEEQNKVA